MSRTDVAEAELVDERRRRQLTDAGQRARVGPASNRTARAARGSPSRARPCRSQSRRCPRSVLDTSRSVTQSARRLVVTATFTISAPVAFIERIRSSRSAGTPSKSCHDRTIRFPSVLFSRSSNPARASTSTYSAPAASASRSSRSALFLRTGERAAFPGRPAGDDDRTAPAGERRADVRIAHAVEPQFDEVGSAGRRRWRRHAAGRDPPSSAPSRSRTVVASDIHKKSLFNRSAEEAGHLLVARWRSGQDGCLFRTGLSRRPNTTATKTCTHPPRCRRPAPKAYAGLTCD